MFLPVSTNLMKLPPETPTFFLYADPSRRFFGIHVWGKCLVLDGFVTFTYRSLIRQM